MNVYLGLVKGEKSKEMVSFEVLKDWHEIHLYIYLNKV